MSMRGRESQSHPYGSSVGQLIDQFATLPGIGRKSAERLAHYILSIPEQNAADRGCDSRCEAVS